MTVFLIHLIAPVAAILFWQHPRDKMSPIITAWGATISSRVKSVNSDTQQ